MQLGQLTRVQMVGQELVGVRTVPLWTIRTLTTTEAPRV